MGWPASPLARYRVGLGQQNGTPVLIRPGPIRSDYTLGLVSARPGPISPPELPALIGMPLSIISFVVLLHLSFLVYQSIPNSNMTTNILLRVLIIYHSSYKILFSIPLYSHFHNTIHIFDGFVCTYLHPLCLPLYRSFINDLSTHLRGQLNT